MSDNKANLTRQFQDNLRRTEWLLHTITVLAVAYAVYHREQVGPDVLTIVVLLGLALFTVINWTTRQWRKRRNAGVVNFQYEHTPSHAARRLGEVTKDYFYVGRSFESMLEAMEMATQKGGMARSARIRLLLADPNDPGQIEFLQRNTPGLETSEATRTDLCRRISRSLTALEGIGKVEIRLYKAPIKGWLHLFDDDRMIFGMAPRGMDGLVAPAVELERVPDKWTLYDHMRDWAEEIWKTATVVEDRKAWKAELDEGN